MKVNQKEARLVTLTVGSGSLTHRLIRFQESWFKSILNILTLFNIAMVQQKVVVLVFGLPFLLEGINMFYSIGSNPY